MKYWVVVACVIVAIAPIDAAGQRRNVDRQIRDAQSRLDSIQRETRELQDQLQRLRGRARDMDAELANLGRQRTATSREVNELDRQMSTLTSQLDTMTFELILVEDALAEKRAVLESRAVAIYKRGALWAFQVLLAAESFGDLLSRYKYLYTVSQQDRSLVDDIGTLQGLLSGQRTDLLTVQGRIAAQREERTDAFGRFASLERQQQRALSQTRRSQQAATARLDELALADQRLAESIVALERARRASGVTLTVSTISTSDLGQLDWPVAGEVIYRFGEQPFRDGTTITRQGIGIRVPEGTPVTAVREGIVLQAERQGTFGPTVILGHGDGYYTIYLNLQRLLVSRGDHAMEGDRIGLSGGASTDEGPHLEFQIRQTPPGSSGPVALNPLNWLKRR